MTSKENQFMKMIEKFNWNWNFIEIEKILHFYKIIRRQSPLNSNRGGLHYGRPVDLIPKYFYLRCWGLACQISNEEVRPASNIYGSTGGPRYSRSLYGICGFEYLRTRKQGETEDNQEKYSFSLKKVGFWYSRIVISFLGT